MQESQWHHSCADGGTGRRDGLKNRWTHVHAGSIPARRTICRWHAPDAEPSKPNGWTSGLDDNMDANRVPLAAFGPLAQLGERLPCTQEAAGSNPARSTTADDVAAYGHCHGICITWATSSFGRALPSQGRGDGFESRAVHQGLWRNG